MTEFGKYSKFIKHVIKLITSSVCMNDTGEVTKVVYSFKVYVGNTVI